MKMGETMNRIFMLKKNQFHFGILDRKQFEDESKKVLFGIKVKLN